MCPDYCRLEPRTPAPATGDAATGKEARLADDRHRDPVRLEARLRRHSRPQSAQIRVQQGRTQLRWPPSTAAGHPRRQFGSIPDRTSFHLSIINPFENGLRERNP